MSEPNQEEFEFEGIYRDYLKEALGRPEVRLAKSAFLNTYFPKQRLFLLDLRVFAPALTLLLLFTFLFIYKGRQSPVVQAPIPSPPALKQPVRLSPQLEVRRVSSDVGSTLVYQKASRKIPVTVVWVFVGGNAGGSQ